MEANLYRYQGCGLDNVYLCNGYSFQKMSSGEDVIAIEDIEGLHRAIALKIVDSPNSLDAKTFRFLRKELDMSQRQFGMLVDVDEQTVSLWERARAPVPRAAELLLRCLVKETFSGHSELKAMIDRLNSLDRELREIEACFEFENGQEEGWALKCA